MPSCPTGNRVAAGAASEKAATKLCWQCGLVIRASPMAEQWHSASAAIASVSIGWTLATQMLEAHARRQPAKVDYRQAEEAVAAGATSSRRRPQRTPQTGRLIAENKMIALSCQ